MHWGGSTPTISCCGRPRAHITRKEMGMEGVSRCNRNEGIVCGAGANYPRLVPKQMRTPQ